MNRWLMMLSCWLWLLLAGGYAAPGYAAAEVPVQQAQQVDQVEYKTAAPDYALAKNWAYLGAGENRPVDLFIVCPTVYRGSETSLNMPMEDEKARAKFVGALRMEMGIYSDSCRVYAPFYRQASLFAYATGGRVLEASLDFAEADVERAFRYYLTELNPDRPFVLAGFSQGSRLMVEMMKHCLTTPQLQQRLVAAYAIGGTLTEAECAAYPQLRPAHGERDTGVVVAFNSEAENVNESMLVPAGMKTLAINPLNWRTDGKKAKADKNLGAWFTDYTGTIKKEIPALCGAYLDQSRGTLKVTGISPKQYPPGLSIFKPGVYHIYDYQFFYRNLQKNVETRVHAYQKTHSKK